LLLLFDAAISLLSEGVLHFATLSVFFLSFDTTAQQRLDGFSPNHPSPTNVFAVLFVNDGTPMKISPPKFLGPKTSIYWSENSNAVIFERPLHRNEKEFLEN